MADIVDSVTRSRMMSGIRGKNTKPEVLLRSLLHRRGLRYRIHDKRLPGAPDIVLPKFRAVIFVHGCFWHGHNCELFRLPATRTDFWRKKFEINRLRDAKQLESLHAMGWRTLVVWECAIRKRSRSLVELLVVFIEEWLRDGVASIQVDSGGVHDWRQNW